MALTPTEEAQARRLLDVLPALEALAASESLISSKLGAQKVNLSQLPVASALNPDDQMLVRQGTVDKTAAFSVLAAAAAGGALLAASNLVDVVNKQSAFNTIKQPATEAVTGVVEFATDVETQAGTDATRAAHPRGILAAITSFFTGRKATQAQVDAKTDDTIYVTPATVASGSDILVNTTTTTQGGLVGATGIVQNGSLRLPRWLGAIQIAWGYHADVLTNAQNITVSVDKSFHRAFTVVYSIVGNSNANGASAGLEAHEQNVSVSVVTNSTLRAHFYRIAGNNVSGSETTPWTYIAIGKWA